MSTNVTWNGITYSIPAAGETGWASLSDFLIALGNGAAVSQEMVQTLNVQSGASYTLSSTTDWSVFLTNAGARAITLPAGVSNQVFMIVDGSDASTGNITITPNGAETIGSAATLVLSKSKAWVMIQYHTGSTDWKIIGQGADLGTLVTLAGSQTLTNKKLVDDSTEIVDSVDPTKVIKFDAGGSTGTSTTIATNQGANVTLTLPAVTDVLVSRTSGDTTGNRLSNKHFEDATFAISDTADNTQQLKFDVQGSGGDVTTVVVNSSTNRSITLPDADGTVGLVPAAGPVRSSGTALTTGNTDLTSEVTGTLPVGSGGTGVTSSTGTGSVVLSNSPALVTPALGTPASGVMTNVTGLPLSTGVTGTLPIGNGGTGQTTQVAALNALLPTQAGHANKFLQSDATDATWQVPSLSDLSDVDPASAEDGQALVYNSVTSKFEPGASGDSSFKLQSIAANNLTLKGGYLKLADGRELATYDGSTYGADLTVSLTTLQATMGTSTWYLYIDIDTLGSEVTLSGSGRKVYAITQSNMVLSTTKPESINRARYAPLGTVLGATPNYSTTNFTTYAAKVHNNGPLAVSPKVYSLSQAVGSVGSASQIKGGHVLEAGSFPSAMDASKASFWNLNNDDGATILDDSTNGRGLTKNGGAVSFGGTNIFGVATVADLDGTDDNFSSSSADLNPANSQSYGAGGWFKATDWTPASQKSMLSQANSGDLSFEIANSPTGVLFRATNTAGSFDASMTIPHTFVDGDWHHCAMVYDFSLLTLKAYIDGKLVGSSSLANLRGASTPNLRVGSLNGGDFFAGAVQDVFIVKNYLLTDADIRKLASTKLTHNASVDAKNQDWKFILGSGVQKHPSWQPVVDQSSSTVLYADFSDLESTETVDVALLDMGMNAVAVPAVPPFDQTYTSNPSFPISHGLGEVPQIRIGYKDASGDWHWTTGEGAVKADATQLKGSIQTYFDASATHVRIVANVGASPTGVKEATDSTSGLLQPVTAMSDALATTLGHKVYSHGGSYNGGNAPTITLSSGGGTLSTVNRADFVPYKTQSGGWRCKFNVSVDLSSASRTNPVLAVAGVSFPTGNQAIAVGILTGNPAYVIYGIAQQSASGLEAFHASTTTSSYAFSGDVALASKPTWAY